MADSSPRFQHVLKYAAWRAISTVLTPIPRAAVVVAADMIGWLLYRVFRVRRDVMDEQLELALGDTVPASEREHIAQRSWQNVVLTFFEFLHPPGESASWGRFDQREGYDEHVVPLLPETNGIFLTAHIGNWEALARLANFGGFQIAAVAKPMHNPLVNASIVTNRHRTGLEVISTRASLKRIASAAKEGKWIAMLGDQDARRHGIFVPFFKTPASTAEGPAYFSWKLNLPIVPSFCVRIDDKHRTLKLINLPAIWPDTAAPREEEIRRLTELHVAALESVIRRYPADYFWLHRRWKTKPKRKTEHPTVS